MLHCYCGVLCCCAELTAAAAALPVPQGGHLCAMASSDKVIRSWEAVTDLVEDLTEAGAAQRPGMHPGIGPDLSTEDVSGGLMICLATLDLGPPAPANTWRVLLQKQVSTSCAGHGI